MIVDLSLNFRHSKAGLSECLALKSFKFAAFVV